ncbi:transporter substrate-binding protein [Alteribacillus sp. JSM 102045]|uniref:transporter substrate-binding protein n=1 Tax=Alteribacillus sp. JSM 102045 TaxID=1562101 RepID=UPI0035BF275D
MKKIGVLFSLTGTTSITEKGQYQAAMFALQEHNRRVKATNDLVEFIIRDIASDPDETINQAQKLIDEGVKVFIGTYTSACRKALLQLLEKHDCILMYPALYEGHETHPNLFYTGEVPNQQVYTLLKYIKKYFGPKIYLIGNEYIYPHATNQEVKKYWDYLGGEIVGDTYVPFGHTHYTDIFQDIQKKSADTIFSTLVGESVVYFYRTFKNMGFHPKSLPIFSPITKETEIQAIGSRYAKGHFSGGSYFQSLDLRENHIFIERFQKQFGSSQVISSVMFNTYLGTKMVIETLVSCQKFERTSFLDSMCDQHFSTPTGMVKVEKENHHISRPIRIGQINDQGQFNIVWDSKKLISAKPYETKTSYLKKEPETVQWEKVFKDLLHHNKEEAVLLINELDEVLYANNLANNRFNFREGQMWSIPNIEKGNKDYNVKVKYLDANKVFKMVVLEPKTGRASVNQQELTSFGMIRTYNSAYKQQLLVAEAASQSEANVLILGETGSGKEVVAQAIHSNSSRKEGPFIPVNAGAIPRDLITSELFGFVAGAFTGAKKEGKAGKFEIAHGGTLFLDEIGDMPLDLQVSLLRVLETKKVIRLGDHKERKVDVRIIAATNRNLQEEIAYQGTFRSDLYYRLNVMAINLPPLRERLEDIKLLIAEFIKALLDQYKTGPSDVTASLFNHLRSYSWPGNIRELRNIIERSFLLARNRGDAMMNVKHLPDDMQIKQPLPESEESLLLEEVEKKTIKKALHSASSVSQAAQLLGVSRSTLYRKMKQYYLVP